MNLLVDFSLETDHSAGGNFILTTLRLKKSFLRLLYFMGGNITEHPLSTHLISLQILCWLRCK